MKELLLGAEAIARGAIDGGISGAFAYPGTPSTEVTSYIQQAAEARELLIRSNWSSNEKTAYEAALGMSFCGKRALVSMKHVGLNVAADGFMNSAITGINGGLVLLVADDPSMHSSQNEQDSRHYGKMAMISIFEPASQQEAYNMVREGFAFSEKTGLPVMVRISTRLSHSRAGVVRKTRYVQNQLSFPADKNQFILLPANARARYKHLLQQQTLLNKLAANSPYNQLYEGTKFNMGILACGLTYNYIRELYPEKCPFPILKIGQYPLPLQLIKRLVDSCQTVLVLEDGAPIVEEQLRGFLPIGNQIEGRLSGILPRDGELNPDHIAAALGEKTEPGFSIPDILANRPPKLCKGCSHIDLYEALNMIKKTYKHWRVFSDIGCYTLGALPPLCAIDSCVDMGAAVTMAKGASDAGLHPALCVIGDSTFTHSGMTGLLDAVNDQSDITVIISDNNTTAMTGGQDSSASGRLKAICKGLGVEEAHIRLLIPLKKNQEENVRIIREEIDYHGVSVIIAQRECIQTAIRRKKKRIA